MRKVLIASTLSLIVAAIAYLQPPAPPSDMATFMPSGALLYLHASDFGRLLREWDVSKVKADWLASDNFEVFSRSNVFTKLSGVYDEYTAAAAGTAGTAAASRTRSPRTRRPGRR